MLVQKQLAGLGRIAPRPQRRLGAIRTMEGVGIRRQLRGLGDNCVITPSGARVCSGDGSLPGGTPGSGANPLNCTAEQILNSAGTACVAALPPTVCKDVIVTPAKTTCTGVAPNRVCVTTPAVTQQVCAAQAPPVAGYVWFDGRWISQAQLTAQQAAATAEAARKQAALLAAQQQQRATQLTAQQQAAIVAQANNAALQTSAPATSVGDTIANAIASIPWYGWVVVAGGAFYFLGGGRR